MDQNWYPLWWNVHVDSRISPTSIPKDNVRFYPFIFKQISIDNFSGDKVHKIGLLIADKNFADKFNIEVESITGFK